MTATKTQHEMVLEYLKEHKEGMTSLDAMRKFGIIQMPKRIFTLKKLGWKIRTESQWGKNRFGNEVRFCRYYLDGRK